MKPDELIPTLLDRFPAFREPWEKYDEVWDEHDTWRSYLDAAQFSQFVIDHFERGDITTVRSAFDCLESMLADTPADSDLAGLIVVGILESIFTRLSATVLETDPFKGYMGPRTTEGWTYLERVWAGKNSLADVIRAELRPGDA